MGRWLRRLVVVAAVAGGAAALRERQLAANAKRYGLPDRPWRFGPRAILTQSLGSRHPLFT